MHTIYNWWIFHSLPLFFTGEGSQAVGFLGFRSFGEETACNSGMIVLGLSKRRCGRDRRETQSTKYMGHTGNTTGIQLILPPILGLSGILVGIECDNSLTV